MHTLGAMVHTDGYDVIQYGKLRGLFQQKDIKEEEEDDDNGDDDEDIDEEKNDDHEKKRVIVEKKKKDIPAPVKEQEWVFILNGLPCRVMYPVSINQQRHPVCFKDWEKNETLVYVCIGRVEA
jgi:hypothetical protein